MKHVRISICALIVLAASSHPTQAQSNPWNGSWKTDVSSMKYTGPTYTVATDADGFTVTMGGAANPKVVCDGQPKTSPTGTAITCVKSASGYEVTTTRDGKTLRKTTNTVSSDGTTLTRKIENFPADDVPWTMTRTSTRVSGGPGFAGDWKETNVSESQDSGILTIAVKGDSIDFKETDQTKPTTCKLDGTEIKINETQTMAVKLQDPHTLKVSYSVGGKVQRENTFVLSTDGKSITETDITPAPGESTTSLVLNKT